MLSQADKEILANKDFQQLVMVRSRVSWSFLTLLLGLYTVYGLMSVYFPEILSRPVLAGGIVPVGVAMGYGILAMTFLITIIYVWLANSYFAPLERKIIASVTAGESE
jgi:uncharacterized membrane protein (DUF485 family)